MSRLLQKFVSLFARKQLFWVVMIGLLILLTFWWIPGDGTGNADTYSVELAGKRVYYEGMRNLLPEVRRSADELIPDDARTIVILGPARIPSDDEWDQLFYFVSNGGTLLYAADPLTESFETSRFRVKFKTSYVAPDYSDPMNAAPGEDQRPTQRIVRTFRKDSIDWESYASLDVPEGTYGVDVLVSDGSVQAVRRSIGTGTAIFVASDIIFQNRSMLDSDKASLASVLLKNGYPYGPVVFDESLNSSGTPRVLGILFTPTFRPLTLQMLICCMLFGWWRSRRFGPAVVASSTDRRAIVEHAQALGSMHYRVGSGAYTLRSYFEYFRNTADLQGGRIDKVAAVLAARSGIEVTEIERLLEETNTAIQNENLGQGTAATLISQLANLKDRMSRFGENRK